MEARIKAIRRKIANLETFGDCNERKREIDYIYLMKQDVCDSSEEEKSDKDKSPMKKEAGCSNSHYKGKYIHWFDTPFKQTFTSLSSVSNCTGKGKGAAENISSAIEAWSLLFSDDLLNIILKYTNEEIERRKIGSRRIKNRRIKLRYHALDMLELKAFIGLLYYAGLKKKNNTFLLKCFSIHGLPLLQATMSTYRFKLLLYCLRFDDETTRDDRIKSDYFTYIREIWNLFVTNCIRYYEPGSNVTIDEYRFEIPISKDISHKHKYGQMTIMNDSDTFYMINAIPYIVNVGTEPLKSYYVRKISEPIHNTYRNITCSNSSFTSVPLVDTMHEKFSLTMIVSLRKDKPYVPSFFKTAQIEKICLFTYQYNKTLVSYKSENNKMILLLSSLYLDGVINKVENKSEILSYYNKTKGASNKFVQLCHEYTVTRKHNLSIRMFNHMLDQAAVNSFVLYTLNADNQVMTRDKFLLDLSMALIKPYFINSLLHSNLHISVQCRLKFFLNEQDLPEEDPRNLRLDISNKLSKIARCSLCPISKRRLTRSKCLSMMHEASICQNCAQDQFFNHLP